MTDSNLPNILHESNLTLGNRALRAGDNTKAIFYFQKALENAPSLKKIINRNIELAQFRNKKTIPEESQDCEIEISKLNERPTNEKITENSLNKKTQKNQNSTSPKKTNIKIAVVLHAFYSQQLNDIKKLTENIEQDFDLFITTPDIAFNEIKKETERFYPSGKIIVFNNNGNDIAPFIELVHDLDKQGYDIVCKIHTKRDHEEYKDTWRLCLLEGVLGSKGLVKEIINTFETDSTVSLIGPALTFASAKMTIYDGADKLNRITSKLLVNKNDIKDWGFFAGTMFWARVDLFRPLNNTKIKDELPFTESKSGELIGSAHLYERIFGLLPYIQGTTIALVDYEAKNGKVFSSINKLKNHVSPRRPLPENLKTFDLIKNNIFAKWSAIDQLKLIDRRWYAIRNPDSITKSIDPVTYFLKLKQESNYLNEEFKTKKTNLTFSDKGIILEPEGKYPNIIPWPKISAGEIFEPPKKSLKNLRNNNEIKVSVICLTYNHEKYIKEALDGFLLQKTNFRFEVLIGDDASSDKTVEIVKEYTEKYPDLFVPILRKNNIGASKNLVDIMSRIRGQYVAINEGDDFWIDPHKLQTQSDYLDSNPECSICFHPVKILNEINPRSTEIFPNNLSGEIFSIEDITRLNFIQTNSVMYRWSLNNKALSEYNINAFPADHYLHTLHAKTGEIHLIPRVMAVYRKNSGGMFSSINENEKLIQKYGIAHIELYRTLDQYTDFTYTNTYLAKELDIHRILFKNYLLENNTEGIYNLAHKYGDVFDIATKEAGIFINTNKLNCKNDLENELRNQFFVSVIITSYNHESYLKTCIENIISQKGFFKLEIIIADDSSTDGSRLVAEECASQHPNIIRLLPKSPNMGMLQNMKRAFDSCSGNFIAICEGDDYWLSDWKIHKQLCMLIKNPKLSMCFNWLLLLYESTKQFIPHPGQARIMNEILAFDDLIQEPLTANFSCCFYRTETIRSIPEEYYTQTRAADWLFNLIAASAGSVGFIKEILSVYRIHSKGQWSGLSDNEMKKQIRETGLQFREFFPGKLLPEFFDENIQPSTADEITNTEDLLFDINEVVTKYNTVHLQGWLIDKNAASQESSEKYFGISRDDGYLLHWQLMENTERPDVSQVFSPGNIDYYHWSGFKTVFSDTIKYGGDYKLWIGQSFNKISPKWKMIGSIHISSTSQPIITIIRQ